MPIHLDLSRALSLPNADRVTHLLLTEVRRLAATPIGSQGGKTTVNAKIKAPLLPFEFGFSHELRPTQTDGVMELQAALNSWANTNGLVFLVDEGDILTDEEFERALLEPLSEAAQLDLPISIVTSGTSVAYLRAVNGGTLSFAPRMVPTLMLPRFTLDESESILRETASKADQMWDGEWVGTLAAASLGLPRLLHLLGSRMFGEIAEGRSPESSIRPILRQFSHQQSQVYHAGLGRCWADAVQVDEWRPSGVDWYELTDQLASKRDCSFDEAERRLDLILRNGLIEVDSEWRVSLVARLPAAR